MYYCLVMYEVGMCLFILWLIDWVWLFFIDRWLVGYGGVGVVIYVVECLIKFIDIELCVSVGYGEGSGVSGIFVVIDF